MQIDMCEWYIKETSNNCSYLITVKNFNPKKEQLHQCNHWSNPSACCHSGKCPIIIKRKIKMNYPKAMNEIEKAIKMVEDARELVTKAMNEIEKAIKMVEDARELVNTALHGYLEPYSIISHYYAYGEFGFRQLLGEGNPDDGKLQDLIDKLKEEGL